MAFQVLDPGFFTTVQDLGRFGYERFGVPVSGAMDAFALRAANRLVGNPENAAGLEIAPPGLALRPMQDCLIAGAGRGYRLEVGGRLLPLWMSVYVRQGEEIRFLPDAGGWGYLAVAGGIDLPLVMGSRSTYLRGGFGGLGGRALRVEDILPTGSAPDDLSRRAGRCYPPNCRPQYRDDPVLEIVFGPQTEAFTSVGLETLLASHYQVSDSSDRMGYRLIGPAVEHRGGADILSDGMTLGSVQIPGNGQPIVMMSDRQTAGGYTKVGVVASADLPLLAQCMPGSGCVRFRQTTVEAAQERYRALMQGLRSGLVEPDDLDLLYYE